MFSTSFPEKSVISRITAKMLIEVEAVRFSAKEPFKFTSGWASPVYIDCRKLISYPRVRHTLMDFAASEITRNIGFESIDSIEDAKAFVNKEIFVPIEEIRQDDDAIYWNDLIGCDVIDQNSKLLGKIYKLENHGASDLIFIETNQEDIIIPLEDQFLGKFDIESNVLNVNWE